MLLVEKMITAKKSGDLILYEKIRKQLLELDRAVPVYHTTLGNYTNKPSAI